MVGQAPIAIKLLNDVCVLWKLLQGRAIMQWPLASGREVRWSSASGALKTGSSCRNRGSVLGGGELVSPF